MCMCDSAHIYILIVHRNPGARLKYDLRGMYHHREPSAFRREKKVRFFPVRPHGHTQLPNEADLPPLPARPPAASLQPAIARHLLARHLLTHHLLKPTTY